MFHPPANAPHAAVAYRTTALDARRQDRAGGPGRFFKIYIFDDCQIIENNNILSDLISRVGGGLKRTDRARSLLIPCVLRIGPY